MERRIKLDITLKRAVQMAIIFTVLGALLILFAARKENSASGSFPVAKMDMLQNEGVLMQKFVPQYEGLSSVSVYLYNEEIYENAGFTFRLFDKTMQLLEQRDILLEADKFPGVCEIILETELLPQETYFYSLENQNIELFVGTMNIEAGLPKESKEIYLFDMPDQYTAVATRYTYYMHMTAARKAFFGIIGVLLCVLLCGLAEHLLWEKEVSVRWTFGLRTAAAVLLSGICLWAAWNVFPLKKFSMDAVNNVFLEVGIFLFLFYALYGLFYKRSGLRESISVRELLQKIPNVGQTLAFAGMMYGCVRYQNALVVHEQQMGRVWVFAGLAAAILFDFSKREALSWYNAVYLPIAALSGFLYYHTFTGEAAFLEEKRGWIIVLALWGLVVLRTIRIIPRIKTRLGKISWWYVLVLVIVFAEMIRSRNTRTWPVDMVVFWGIFALQIIVKGHGKRYLENFTNGALLYFLIYVWDSIRFRPFHYYHFTRYGGMFHTVTFATVFDALMVILALVRVLAKYRKKKLVRLIWVDLGILALTTGFLLLTGTRTGYLGGIFSGLIIFLFASFLWFKDGLKGLLIRMGCCITVVIVGFIISFSACRMVPAVIGKPFIYEFEQFESSVLEGEPWNSHWFVTIQRFVEIAWGRVLNNGQIKDSASTNGGIPYSVTHATETAVSKTVAVQAPSTAEQVQDYSNGRLSIFKAYLKALDWKGHESIDLEDESGQNIAHAHNSFIQQAYNFGLAEGILFLLLSILAGIRSMWYAISHREEETALVPLGLIGIFGICSLTEMVFFTCYPGGIGFLMALVILIPKTGKISKKIKQD